MKNQTNEELTLEEIIREEIVAVLKEKKKRKLTAKPSSETSLRDWFGRKGAKGKKGGWVDCNTCRKDKKTGKKTCKACGRSGGEKRAKYPKCVPIAKARRMSESQRRSAVKRKRAKAQGVGGKPTNVKTFASKGMLIETYYQDIL